MFSTSNVADQVDPTKPLFTYSFSELERRLSQREEAFMQKLLEMLYPYIKSPRKKWLTKKESCAEANVSMVTLDSWIRSGKLKIHRPSQDRILIASEDLDAFISSTKAA